MKLLFTRTDIEQKLRALLEMEGLVVENFEWQDRAEVPDDVAQLAMDFKVQPPKEKELVEPEDDLVLTLLYELGTKIDGLADNTKPIKGKDSNQKKPQLRGVDLKDDIEEAIRESNRIEAEHPFSGNKVVRRLAERESYDYPA